MVGHKGKLSLREVPAMARYRHRLIPHVVVCGGITRRMLQGNIPTVGLSLLHVFAHNPHLRRHGLCLCCDQQGRGAGGVQPGI